MSEYQNERDYLSDLKDRAVLPSGFRVAAVPISFFPTERAVSDPLKMNLSLIALDKPTGSFAAVFTRNAFPGAPVKIGRRRLSEAKAVSGVLINNKISNVCAEGGEEDAEEILSVLGKSLGVPRESLFPASTGIIGWRLPKKEMKEAIPELTAALDSGTLPELARAIMTTDAFPKIRSAAVGSGVVTAVAKGAGMIEPNMATMLCFIMTDITVSRDDFRRALNAAVDAGFNSISVDGDQSTSDTVLAFSSCQKDGVPYESFANALKSVCVQLAEDIVRNGEGVHHVIKVKISGALDDAEAKRAGKAIVNSPLVKTAVFGNDPNVGRLISALGDDFGNHGALPDPEKVTVSLGGRTVFRSGSFVLDEECERFLSQYLKLRQINPGEKRYPEHENCVEIEISLGDGDGRAVVVGADLTYDYVKENADYRS